MSQATIASDGLGAAGSGRRVTFSSRAGRRLVGTLHEGGQPSGGREERRAAVVLCHGMESTREGIKHVSLAHRFAAVGLDCLRFDFGFVGESQGEFSDLTISGETEDALGALDFMAAQGARDLALVGSSLGGTVAILAAARFPAVRALATIAAVSRPRDMLRRLGEEEIERWRRSGVRDFGGRALKSSFIFDAERLDVLGAAAALGCPVLITHGEEDRVVPPEDARALAAALGEKASLELYPEADHRFSDPQMLGRLLARIVSWVAEKVGRGGSPP